MKTKISWFIFGFIISWLIWLTIEHIKFRPHDLTKTLPKEISSFVETDDMVPWLRSAQCIKLGAFKIVKPVDPSDASAGVFPLDDTYPRVYLFDDDVNGKPNSIIVQDSLFHMVGANDKDGDGIFDFHDFATGISSNSISVIDGDMDSIFDLKIGPNDVISVNVDGCWYELIRKDGKTYINDNGTIKEVEGINAVYRIKKAE